MEEHVTLSGAAEIANLEVKYFSRFFRRQTGLTFSVWCRIVRTHKAKELLENGLLTVSEIAELVGYADITTFERNFKKVLGVNPRRYRVSLSSANETAMGAPEMALPVRRR